MRKYHKKAERKDDLRNVDFNRLKKGLSENEADIDVLVKFSSIELFLHHRFLDEQKAFKREYGIKGYRITPAVYEILEKSHLESGKMGRRE